jgi:hypothetical protein
MEIEWTYYGFSDAIANFILWMSEFFASDVWADRSQF